MRIAYYPSGNSGSYFAWEHADINLLTVIPEASTTGLEVLENTMEWISCDPGPGQAVVLFGDMIADFSNHTIPATKHRVVNSQSERLSFSFFANPNRHFRLSERWTAGEFLDHRMKEVGLAV